MGVPDKDRELFVCKIVAEELNRLSGTDYRPTSCEERFPDVLFVSDSGGFPTREVEVVSTPQDFTIRPDNKNVRNFERQLDTALHGLGMSGCQVQVNWHRDAIRFGMKTRVIPLLAQIIRDATPEHGHVAVRGEDIYEASPEVSQAVNYFRVVRIRSLRVVVHSSSGFWAPNDGVWIEEAVAKKSAAYRDESLCRRLLLVIDGLYHLDTEQMAAYRASNPPETIPFGELWAVTMGRAYRLKP
jgi:hypothetical protein